jgi:adenylate cyclase
VVVKGKREPVGVYEVLDYHTELTFPNMSKVLIGYEEGLNLYRQARFEEAIAVLHNVLAFNDRDRLPHLYIDRCRRLIADPPGDDWDSVWVLTEK